MTGDRTPLPIHAQSREAMRLHLESILDSVPDAMVVIDQNGQVIAFSRAAEALFGYSPDDIVGRPVTVLMTGSDEHRHDDYMRRYMDTGEARIIGIGRVVRARKADGTEFPVDLKIGEARIGDERVFTGFLRDLTEQQQAELRMRDMQAELAHFSRLSALATMASAMAHELNQPLTAVANYLEAGRDLLTTPDDASIAMVQEALDEAAKQAVRAGQIVRKLRDYVSTGEVVSRPISLQTVARDAATMAQLGASGNAAVEVELPADLPRVAADPVQVQQVVMNLVRNALEALEAQKYGLVNVTARLTDGMVETCVKDNGPGLDPSMLDQVFKPFRTTKTTGMGLGLSICKTIVEAHGGSIRVDCPKGGGSLFCFTLPVALEREQA